MTLEFATVAYTLANLEVAGLEWKDIDEIPAEVGFCLLYTSPSPRDRS